MTSQLLELAQEILHLESAQSLLGWDQDIHMPPGGAESRAKVLATLAAEIHRKTVNPRLGDLANLACESEDAVTREIGKYWKDTHEDALKVPEQLVSKMAKAASESEAAWHSATTFAEMEGHLTELVALNMELAACHPEMKPYDALIDVFDEGVTQVYLDQTFAVLRPALLNLRSKVPGSGPSDYHQTSAISADALLDLCTKMTEALGFDYDCGNLSVTEHPFMATIAPGDARIATKVKLDDPLWTITGAIHEAGHAMYEQGTGYSGTGLDHLGSMGLHESQSLFWEIMVGKSPEFWETWFDPLNSILTLPYRSVEALVADLHRHNPNNVIRLESGDLDYGLHIMLRYDVERALFNKDIEARHMKDKFNALCVSYFGATPKDDRREGVLQDVHWSGGWFGYFPSYLLGASFAAQLKAMCPDDRYLEFLRQSVHRHGGRYTFQELTDKYLGGYDPRHYVKYLESVYL